MIECHQDRLYRLALAWLGNSDFAEDAVQEAFPPGFNSLPRFCFGAALFSWLYRILCNICCEINHRQSKLKAFENAELAVWKDRTEHRAAGEQSLERIRALIVQLPTRQQEVVLLRLFEKCLEEEIANAMGCRRGTAKALLYKAATTTGTSRGESLVSEADWEKLKDDYQSPKAPEQSQPRILLAMEPQRSGFTPVRVWQIAALLDPGVAGVWGTLQFQPRESKQMSKLSAHVFVSTGVTLPKHPLRSSVWLGMSKPTLRSLAIIRPRLSSMSLCTSSRFLLGSRPRKGR